MQTAYPQIQFGWLVNQAGQSSFKCIIVTVGLIWQHCHRSFLLYIPRYHSGHNAVCVASSQAIPAVDGSSEVPPIGESSTSFPAMSQLLSEADVDVSGKASLPLPATASKPAAEILLGHGIPPLPKKMVERMIHWEYVDFSELPPTKISGLKVPMDNGTILLVQVADLLKQQRRLIPNITVCMGPMLLHLRWRDGNETPRFYTRHAGIHAGDSSS